MWDNRDRAYNVKCLVKRLQRIDKEMSGEARELFKAFVPDGDLSPFAKALPQAVSGQFTTTMNLLRDENFQNLLNRSRAVKPFTVAYNSQDEVTSGWLIRDGAGKEHKPADYLRLFADYVRKNPDQIEALRILHARPEGWGPEALAELRRKLGATALRFTEDNLSKAHESAYNKALVDLISMVKHAADDKAPLLTAEERADLVIGALSQNQAFSEAQQVWLGRIREHLVVSLSIERADFDERPIFERHGGWGQADKAFGGLLEPLLLQLNKALAA